MDEAPNYIRDIQFTDETSNSPLRRPIHHRDVQFTIDVQSIVQIAAALDKCKEETRKFSSTGSSDATLQVPMTPHQKFRSTSTVLILCALVSQAKKIKYDQKFECPSD